jgi:ligand-binding sensor domain-containing protein
MNRRLLVLSALGLALHVSLQAEHLPIRTYTTADDLGHNTVNRIVRDSRGLLWFCTAGGLSRFDGYTFTNFGLGDGLPDASVNDLLETRAGEYWVATDGGLVRFEPRGTPMFTTVLPVDQSRHARTTTVVREGHDGTIWVGTHKDLYRLAIANGRPFLQVVDIGLPTAFPDQRFIEDILEDSRGSLWIGATTGLYRRWPDGGSGHYTARDGFPETFVDSLIEDHQGRLWAGTRVNGFFGFHADETHRPPIIDRSYTESDHGLPTSWVSQLFEASDRRFWVLTARGLVEFFPDAGEQERFRIYTQRNGLSDYELTTVAEDRNGNLWLGTPTSGAMRVTHGGFITYGKEDGIETVYDIFEDRAGDLCFKGTVVGDARTSVFEGATLSLLTNHEPTLHTRYGAFDGHTFDWFSPAGVTTSGWAHHGVTLQSRDGAWWVGTGDGVYRFPAADHFSAIKAARGVLYTVKDGLAATQVYRLFEDSRGDIWISTTSSRTRGLAVWERATGRVRNLAASEGLPSFQDNLPRAFAEDASGNVWIGLTRGLVRSSHGSFATFTERDGLPRRPITDIYRDRTGRLWLASLGGGLVRVDHPAEARPTFVAFTTAQGLSNNDIEVLAGDAVGNIYAGGGHGFDRIDPATSRVRHFSTSDGLPPRTAMVAYQDRHGVLWIGLAGGLARLVSEKVPEAPPVFVTELRVAGLPQRVSALGERDITLSNLAPAQNQLQIDFAAFGASPGDGLRYQYRLQGADTDWGNPGAQRTVTYARLAPGRYQFQVRAMNADGIVANVPATITFIILGPLWLRWWFLTAAACLVGVVVNALYRRRLARLLDLANLRTRIATDLHDDIGANLTRIALLSEVAHQPSIGHIARESVSAMSDIVWAINPARDSLLDLVRKMRQHADELFTRRNIELHLTTPLDRESLRLGVDVRRDVLLIFKEAVNNAARHSSCSRVDIDLRVEGSRMVLSVRDNGVGFAPAAESDGQGLASMSRRARRLGGTLDVTSGDSGGTSVTLSIPL